MTLLVGARSSFRQRSAMAHWASLQSLVVVALLLLMASCVTADVDTSMLQVHIPPSLSKKGGYDHRDALFGIPPYGGSISGKVYYADHDLCGPVVHTKMGYPVEVDAHGDRVAWQSPYILLVDRGNCTFVQKVRNAQRAGAAAVLIADTTCLCGALHTSCTMGPDQTVCEQQEPIMADDGSGADISIPSFLTFKQDADAIKDVLVVQNQPVRVELSFSVPAPDGRVEYDLWTTAADDISRPFLQSFAGAAQALGTDAFFTPRMYIYDGMKAGCHETTGNGENYCGNLCTNAGRYCATDPDGDLDAGVSGQDVVGESLRRMCLWNAYGSDGIGAVWWTYVNAFMDSCSDPEQPLLYTQTECIEAAMTKAGVDVAQTNQCMDDAGGLEADGINTLLELSVNDQEVSGAVIIPTLFVNKAAVRGELVYSTVFGAICAGYSTGTEPSVCQTCAHCHDTETCVAQNKCTSGRDGSTATTTATPGVSSTTFASSMLAVSLAFSVAGFVVYQRQQRRMREEVRGIMAEYMPIDINNKTSNGDNTVSEDFADENFSIT